MSPRSKEAARCGTSLVIIRRLLGIDTSNVSDIIPVSLPDAQDLEPPLRTIALHPCDHSAQNALVIGGEKWPAVKLPQCALVPKLESSVQVWRIVVVHVFDDEILLAAWL